LLRQRGVKTRVIEVINGYRESDVIPESEIVFRSGGTARVLFLGRIETINKGIDLLIDAFDGVAESVDAELTVQGPEGGDLAGLKARASGRKHGGRIRFAPPDFATTPAKIAAGYDVFVIPSRFEGFSLAAMEAMLAARPVVISDIAGLSPHVRAAGCGVVVDANVASIREGILSVLKRRGEWEAMGMAGRRYALERFQWKRIAGEAMEEYGKVSEARG
jgi:glycosyltransferase involved in cell wall biosynthesis